MKLRHLMLLLTAALLLGVAVPAVATAKDPQAQEAKKKKGKSKSKLQIAAQRAVTEQASMIAAAQGVPCPAKGHDSSYDGEIGLWFSEQQKALVAITAVARQGNKVEHGNPVTRINSAIQWTRLADEVFSTVVSPNFSYPPDSWQPGGGPGEVGYNARVISWRAARDTWASGIRAVEEQHTVGGKMQKALLAARNQPR